MRRRAPVFSSSKRPLGSSTTEVLHACREPRVEVENTATPRQPLSTVRRPPAKAPERERLQFCQRTKTSTCSASVCTCRVGPLNIMFSVEGRLSHARLCMCSVDGGLSFECYDLSAFTGAHAFPCYDLTLPARCKTREAPARVRSRVIVLRRRPMCCWGMYGPELFLPLQSCPEHFCVCMHRQRGARCFRAGWHRSIDSQKGPCKRPARCPVA